MLSVSKSGKGKSSWGYTLIEFAIVLSVTGVLVAAFATAYNIYLKTQQQLTTENNETAVMGAVSNYLIQNGAYPCPARSNAKRTDADYGIATQCDPAQTVDNGVTPVYPLTLSYPCSATSPGAGSVGCTVGAHGAGTCSNGLCWEQSNRSPGLAKPLVRRGMVPFRTLGLSEDYALDGYKSRFAYAVTEALAVPGTYSIANGGIDITDQFGASMVKSPFGSTGGSAHFVLFSSGLDRAGAYSREGVVMFPCPTVGLDAENCNTLLVNTAVYRLAPYSETHIGSGAVPDWHFDDSVKYFSTVQTPLWKIADSTGYHIVDLVGAGTTGTVGVKTNNPTTTVGASKVAIDVAGSVHTAQNVDTAQICPPGSTTSCFPVSASLNCPVGGATQIPPGLNPLTGLGCTTTPQVVCPVISGVQTLMVGVDATNHLICANNSNCPVKNTTLCSPPGTNFTLPAAATGSTQSLSAGFSYVENWKCTGGTWQKQGSSGICTCTAGTNVNSVVACSTQYGTGAGTYTGTFTTTTTTTCAPYGVSTSTTNTCACTNTTGNQSITCPTGFTGGPVTQSRTWTCNPVTNTGVWSAWADTGGTPCTCNASATQSQTIGCPVGYTGTGIVQKSTFNCGASPPAWGPWVTQTTNCTCD